MTEAAQAVQRSGFPDAYAQWEQHAAELVEAARNAPAIDSPDGVVPGRAAGCEG